MHLPLGDSRAGGPSINVGGERNGLVSDEGRPRGEGTYGDLSAGNKGMFGECKWKKICSPAESYDRNLGKKQLLFFF